MIDRDAVLTAFNDQLRNVIRPSRDGRAERAGAVIRFLSTHPDGWSGIEWSDVDESTADQVIAEQVAYFRSHDRTSWEWKYYAYDRPADLPARLRAAGLTPDEEEALMIAATADVPDHPSPPGIRLTTVSTQDALAHVKWVHDKVFGGDHTQMIADMWDRLQHEPDTVTPVLALAGDQPVCASRIDFHVGTDFASLWGGGTLPEWRGKGIYRAMVSYRAKLATERGYRYLRTDALPPSRPILERLGFERLTTTVPYTPA